MPNTKLSALPSAVAVSGTDELYVNEAGVSKKVTASQMADFASQISVLGSPAVNTQQEYNNTVGSAGFFNMGMISDAGSGSINISAGSGMIRATTTHTDPLLSFEWSAFSGIAIPSGTARYVYISYGSGSPTYELSTSEFEEEADKILIGSAVNEGGLIISVVNFGVRLNESIGQAGRFIRRTMGISRDIRHGGLILGETGTRNITLSTGHLWFGRTDYTVSDFNSSGPTDRFDIYHRAVSGFTKIAAASQWPNGDYDSGTGLTALGAGKWGVLWFYVELDDQIVMMYGRAQHNTLAAAEQQAPPSTLPNRLLTHGVLAGRLIFKRLDPTGVISSAFDTTFTLQGVTDHGDLAGLTDPDHPSTALAMSTTDVLVGRSEAGAGASQEIPCSAAGRAVIAADDAGLVRVGVLSSGLTPAGSGMEVVTGLSEVVGSGTWAFKYFVVYRSSNVATGIKCSVNHSGTLSFFVANTTWVGNSSSDASDVAKQNATTGPQVMSSMSARVKSAEGWGPLGGVDDVNVDMLIIIEGLMAVDVSGNIELYVGNEIDSAHVTVMAKSALILTKVA